MEMSITDGPFVPAIFATSFHRHLAFVLHGPERLYVDLDLAF